MKLCYSMMKILAAVKLRENVMGLVKNILCVSIHRLHLFHYCTIVFLEFPPGCRSYEGPHTTSCLHSAIEMTELSLSGQINPVNLTEDEMEYLNSLNLQ